MASRNYKKYMKQESVSKEHNLIKLFIISFCGMLLFFIFIIKSFSPPVDTSIGDNQSMVASEEKEDIDGRLSALQEEDREKSFSELMEHPTDVEVKTSVKETSSVNSTAESHSDIQEDTATQTVQQLQPVFKVYIGSYTSAEQAKVARDIIQDAGNGLTPIVKCIGSNNYTLQVGSFKSKGSAETMLYSIQQNHLPGRIVQEY